MSYKEDIRIYGEMISNTELSPFETLEALHIRSELQEQFSNLTKEEKIALISYDVKLLGNAEKMIKHIGQVYNFAKSTEPIQEWWWHLNKVVDGTFQISVHVENKDKAL
ncbi:hypothetical protein COA01_29500 [Bacillus cereus]|uniref:hypothetical protein n=1 Tax=Bacillus cereus TaxID=1396 RepID=UPI000BFD6380|nr:hypothetical protein [Bacillus cereus]PGP14502.1 hypothetical protein COA01_29500 [Bacillus cereus]